MTLHPVSSRRMPGAAALVLVFSLSFPTPRWAFRGPASATCMLFLEFQIPAPLAFWKSSLIPQARVSIRLRPLVCFPTWWTFPSNFWGPSDHTPCVSGSPLWGALPGSVYIPFISSPCSLQPSVRWVLPVITILGIFSFVIYSIKTLVTTTTLRSGLLICTQIMSTSQMFFLLSYSYVPSFQ